MTEIDFGNYFTNYTETVAPETEIAQGMFDSIVNFTPNKCHVKDRLFFKNWHSRIGIQELAFKNWHSRIGIQELAFKNWHSKIGLKTPVPLQW